MSTSKVSVHGHGDGIGDYLVSIAEPRITTTTKSIDNAGWAAEACKISVDYGVYQNVIMRWSAPGGIPDGAGDFYRASPKDSAIEYHGRVMQMWANAPELHDYKDLLWIELGNELRTQYDPNDPNFENMHPVNWLGWWGLYIAKLFVADGFNIILFGMNAGTPEPEDWLQPGMMALFEYIDVISATSFSNVALSVHEGMGTLDWRLARPAENVPYINGRYKNIIEACHTLGVSCPEIFISEWAWRYDEMPPTDRALEDVLWMAEFYDLDAQVSGVCLWNLDKHSSSGTVAQQMVQFLPHLAAFNVNWRGPGPVEPPLEETLEEHLWRTSLEHQVLSLNADAALQRAITWDGYSIVGDEYWTKPKEDGVVYAAQPAEHYEPGHPRRVYYTEIGNWNSVRWIEDPASTTPPPSYPPLSGLKLGPVFNVAHAITSKFNAPRSYANGLHEGIDLDVYSAAIDSREPVVCAYDGFVHFVERGTTGYANHVVVKHSYNGVDFFTWYAHLDDIYVVEGQYVNDGQPLGEIGATGNTGTPPAEHVHFNLQVPGYGLSGYYVQDVVDPEEYYRFILPPVAQGAQLGLHATADVAGRWHVDDFSQYTTARVEAVKVLSSHDPADIALLKSQNNTIKTWVVRAFLVFGGRAVTPQQFFDWTYSDVKRTLDVIGNNDIVWVELGNEPNLVSEGYGTAYANALEYTTWFESLLRLYKAALPGVRFLYPGLSPGGDGGPTAREFFWQIPGVDGYGVHAYWGISNNMYQAVDEVSYFAATGMPIIVTEASNKGVDSDSLKGTEYIDFSAMIPAIAVTYFVCSARHDPQKYTNEVWVGTVISKMVGNR